MGNVEEQKKKAEGEDSKKNGNEQEIVLKVDMHCEACAKKIIKVVRSFPGVEDVKVDRQANVIVVKAGKTVEATQVSEAIQKKSGRKVQIISPLPKPNPNPQQPNEPKKDQKDQPPPATTVTLQVYMHCEACAQILRKRIQKIKGIESVETDLGKDQVTVKGVIPDPSTLVKQVYKKTGKRASIVVQPKEEKKQDSGTSSKSQAKNEEAGSSKQQQDTDQSADKKAIMGEPIGRYEYYWPTPTRNNYNYNMDYYNYLGYNQHHPQHFSDENPASCSIV